MQALIPSLICLVLCAAAAVIGSPLAGQNPWPPVDTSSCEGKNVSKTKSCLNGYFGYFGIRPNHGLPTYEDYKLTIDEMLNGDGVRGLREVIQHYNSFASCMGDLDLVPCLSSDNFQKMFGVDDINGKKYSVDLAVRQFVAQNEKDATTYFPCLWDKKMKFFSDLDVCQSNIDVDVSHGVNICTAYTNYLRCTEKVFSPCGNDAKMFACYVEETAIQSDINNYCWQKLYCNQ